MSNRGSNSRSPGYDGNFERNKHRQTMPSRFNPMSSPTNGGNQRTHSPTQSFVSTATTYEQPWNSPKFRAPGTPAEPRFRRTHSMAAKHAQSKEAKEDEKADRPKINFMELGKKITNKFKKNHQNKNNDQKKAERKSAPIIKLGESSSASQPDLPSTVSPISANKVPSVKAIKNIKMQPEDRMKMFQKMGREQSLKVTNLQRMQRERQKDFNLLPTTGKPSIEANRGSNQSIDSMLVFNTTVDSRRSTSLSLIDDDVEPVFKNSRTNKPITSAQYNNQQKLASGPSFTSTPRYAVSAGLQADSPTISNVRSASEASYCMMSSADAHSTIYFSADTLNSSNPPTFKIPNRHMPAPPARSMVDVSLASTASTPVAPTPSEPDVPLKRVKEEVVENDNRSSTCPSFSSTPPPTSDLVLHQNPPQNSQPEHLNTLWTVSKEIRDNQLQLERSIPLMETMRNRAMSIDQQKMILLGEKGDNPTIDDMRQLWNLDREFLKVTGEMNMASIAIQNANNLLPFLEMRRNELLSVSPPPAQSHGPSSSNNFPGGSFV